MKVGSFVEGAGVVLLSRWRGRRLAFEDCSLSMDVGLIEPPNRLCLDVLRDKDPSITVSPDVIDNKDTA